MGCSESRSELTDRSLEHYFNKNYEFEKEIEDLTFGRIFIYKNIHSNQYLMKSSRIFTNKSDFENFSCEIVLRKKLFCNNLVKVFGSEKFLGGNFCSEIGRIDFYSEYFEHNLLQELKIRKENLVNINFNFLFIYFINLFFCFLL